MTIAPATEAPLQTFEPAGREPARRSRLRLGSELVVSYLPALLALIVQVALLVLVARQWQALSNVEARLGNPPGGNSQENAPAEAARRFEGALKDAVDTRTAWGPRIKSLEERVNRLTLGQGPLRSSYLNLGADAQEQWVVASRYVTPSAELAAALKEVLGRGGTLWLSPAPAQVAAETLAAGDFPPPPGENSKPLVLPTLPGLSERGTEGKPALLVIVGPKDQAVPEDGLDRFSRVDVLHVAPKEPGDKVRSSWTRVANEHDGLFVALVLQGDPAEQKSTLRGVLKRLLPPAF
jgi:hypothetical protein